jgi:hypothetical protein
MNKKQVLQQLISAYSTAIIKTKKSNVEATLRYLERNNLDSGICAYLKYSEILINAPNRTNVSIKRFIDNNKRTLSAWWCDPPFHYDDKKGITNSLKTRLNILEKEYNKCN